MKASTRAMCRELRWMIAIAGGALALIPAAGAISQVLASNETERVYRTSVVATLDNVSQTWNEYVQPSTGKWRIEAEDGQVRVFSGNQVASVDPLVGPSIRVGSPKFLGYLVDAAVSASAVKHLALGTELPNGIRVLTPAGANPRYEVTRGRLSAVVTVHGQEDLPASQLAPPTGDVGIKTTERQVGVAPTSSVSAYWLGPQFRGRTAVTAVEIRQRPTEFLQERVHHRASADLYITFYERPGSLGTTSAYVGHATPEGEIQVVNQDVSSELAQGAIDAFNGKNGEYRYPSWPREQVVLANGERATLVMDRAEAPVSQSGELRFSSFSIITNSTLVSVIAPVTKEEAKDLATGLQPITG
jgi:hypothetical protein